MCPSLQRRCMNMNWEYLMEERKKKKRELCEAGCLFCAAIAVFVTTPAFSSRETRHVKSHHDSHGLLLTFCVEPSDSSRRRGEKKEGKPTLFLQPHFLGDCIFFRAGGGDCHIATAPLNTFSRLGRRAHPSGCTPERVNKEPFNP